MQQDSFKTLHQDAVQQSKNDKKQSKKKPDFNLALDPILSLGFTAQKCGISACTIWRLRRLGQFPTPIKLTVKRIGWRASTLDAWIEAREAQL